MGMSSQAKTCHKVGTICIIQKIFNRRQKWFVFREEGKGRESSFQAESE